MKEKVRTERECGHCGRLYNGYPALSRADNRTQICPECGTREALESIGLPAEEIDGIIDVLRKNNVIEN